MRRAAWLGALGIACLAAAPARAASLDLATLSCDRYEREIVGTANTPASTKPDRAPQPAAAPPDGINLVMWLFGYAVASAGEHFMYGDALASFGFALDARCKSHPASSVLEAVRSITPKRDQPMDLTLLNCGDFEARHMDSARSDPDSAKTIMMWLFGFSVGLSGSHLLDPDGVEPFSAALAQRCAQNPNESLFESLSALARASDVGRLRRP